jgi:hypothetical protein
MIFMVLNDRSRQYGTSKANSCVGSIARNCGNTYVVAKSILYFGVYDHTSTAVCGVGMAPAEGWQVMNIYDLFIAKTEQQLRDIIESNDGFIKLHSVMQSPQVFNEFIADVASDTRITRPGRNHPATVIYVATLPAQSLQITCTTGGISLFVNSIEETL